MDCKTARLLKIIDKRFPGCFACITTNTYLNRDGQFEVEYIFTLNYGNCTFTNFKTLETFIHKITDTLPDVLTVNDVLNEGGSELEVK